MFKLNRSVKVSEICSSFNFNFSGEDLEIRYISSLDNLEQPGTLTFSKKSLSSSVSNQIVVSSLDSPVNTIVKSQNPRLDFAKLLNWLLLNVGLNNEDHQTNIHPTVRFGQNCFVGKGVTIDQGTVIGHNVVINDGVHIGKFCSIKSNTVIGEDGFGYERDINGDPIKFPHIGSVKIGDYVDLGSLNTVVRGALGDTVIKDGTKTDDHVHIAHNCFIEENVLLTACAELSGGVTLKRNSWIGPNSSIMQKVTIGENSFVGLGTVVLKDVGPNRVVAGVPAKEIPKKT